MAYNKSKFVESAQKLLNQGKVPQAIAEYQQILKFEPRDQVTLMTIGELYIRQGETFQAIDYFERLAQIFVGDGFLTKAIAVYKRIAKLAPEEIRPLEKLADLYVQQGVMSEARPLFLQLAEIHLKNNRQPEAIALLKKLLQAEPDNLRIQIRLADLYSAMGQGREALDTYVSASQRALARGDHAECEKLADKALKIEATNLPAIIVKARSYSSQGNVAQAAELLERVPDLDKGGESAELLLDLYLKNAKWKEATDFALRIFESDEKNFGAAQKVTESLLESGQGESAMALISRLRLPMLDAGEHEVAGKLLNDLAAHLPGRIEPLEWLVDTYGRTSDSFRLPDALAQLGDALAAAGKYERAKEVFEQLVDREPESDSPKRKLNGVLRKMGLLEPEEVPNIDGESLQAELPEAPAPKLRPDIEPESTPVVDVNLGGSAAEPALDQETQKFIAQSLTDVDLFASYGLTQKAIGLLEAILRRAPRHTPTLEKLLDFVLGAGDDRRTAELAAQLEQIHTERGDSRSAERFGELRRRFQRAAGLTDEEIAASVAPISQQPAGPAEIEPSLPEAIALPAAEVTPTAEISAKIPEISAVEVSETIPEVSPQGQTHEVDLSEEWASLDQDVHVAETPAPPPPAAAAKPGEAVTPGKKAPAKKPPAPEDVEEFALPEFAIAAESVKSPAPAKQPAAAPLAGAEETLQLSDVPELVEESAAAKSDAVPPVDPALVLPETVHLDAVAKEPDFELEQDFELVLDPEPLVPAYDQKPPEKPVAAAKPEAPTAAEIHAQHTGSTAGVFSSDQFLADLAAEIDQLGIGENSPAVAEPAKTAAPPPAKPEHPPLAPGQSAPLQEVFDEFRAELGEMGVEDEDLETHYNLGIAFREMGLLEEAISEFQKVAKANERGKPFRYSMQCCTLLGLAFMEKGEPGIAAIWYQRALLTPSIEPESILALRYDLGVAQESAGDIDAARKSFSEVYAVNIDYRDVAERIAALQKTTR
jgi:tetratricopeptide (TPR) repeat protein